MTSTRLFLTAAILISAVKNARSWCRENLEQGEFIYMPCYYHHSYNNDNLNQQQANLCKSINPSVYREITCSNDTIDNLKDKILTYQHGRTFRIQLVFKDASLPSLSVPIIPPGNWSITKIELTNLNMSYITPGYFDNFHNLTELRLDRNKLTEVTEGVLSSIGSLTSLNLSHNEVNKLSDHSFSGNEDLTVLDLSNNRITKLPERIFVNQKQLEVLDVSHNKLQGMIDFKNLPMAQLKTLELSYNEINTLSNFNGSTELTSFSISNNNITFLSKLDHVMKMNASFNYIQKLEKNILSPDLIMLDLSYNSINDISEKAFENLTELEYLHLQHNNVRELPASVFKDLQYLHNVDLSYNNLVKLQSEVFNNSEMLKFLDISHNNLGNLTKFDYVIRLNASFNRITIIENDILGLHLVSLDLSSNSISEISVKAFANLKSLESLYLEYNNLSTLPSSCFRGLDSLKYLDLAHNRLVQLPYGLFNHLNHQEYLDISYNNMNLELQAIFALKELKTLKLAYNRLKKFDAETLLEHFRNLELISLENNFWTCKELTQIVHTIHTRYYYYRRNEKALHIAMGNNYEGDNVLGIACKISSDNSTENIDKPTNDLQKKLDSYLNTNFTNTNFYKYLESLKLLQNKQNYGSEITASMLKYLEGDFKNSSFYKLLENTVRYKTYDTNTIMSRTDYTSNEKGNNIFNIIFCIILLCVLCLLVYQMLVVKKTLYHLNRDNLELSRANLLNN